MRQRFHVRLGVTEDAGRLAVLAAQVWLHTYATDGISTEIAALRSLAYHARDSTRSCCATTCTQVLVAMHAHQRCLVSPWYGSTCRVQTSHDPDGGAADALYVQEHFLRQGSRLVAS